MDSSIVVATFNGLYCLWMGTLVESVVSVIRALVTVWTCGVGGLIWAEQVLSARRMEPVDSDADGDPELPSSYCIPNRAGRDSVNASIFLQKRCVLSHGGIHFLRRHEFMCVLCLSND